MIVLRIALSLYVPILDSPNDMRFIGSTKLQLNLIAPVGLNISQEQIQSPCSGLNAFLRQEINVTETDYRRIFSD